MASRRAPAHTLTDEAESARAWVSTEDLRFRLTELPRLQWQTTPSPGAVVDVNGAETFQVMLGFGSSLEPATCWNLWRMTKADRYNSRPRPGDAGLSHPRTVLSDPGAAAFVAGVAFHGYVGQPSGMDEFRREFPSVPLHFTEGSVFGLKGGIELIERLRNHASSYNAWVTVLDDRGKPNNGPFEASRTIITVNPETFRPALHFDYYLYGHFMRAGGPSLTPASV